MLSFDREYYLVQNPDVAAMGVDAEAHYRMVGYLEGRDPCASFDTAHYLSENPEVAILGMNPLDHYNQSGMVDGCLPSVNIEENDVVVAPLWTQNVESAGVVLVAPSLPSQPIVECSPMVDAVGHSTVTEVVMHADVEPVTGDLYEKWLDSEFAHCDADVMFDTSYYLVSKDAAALTLSNIGVEVPVPKALTHNVCIGRDVFDGEGENIIAVGVLDCESTPSAAMNSYESTPSLVGVRSEQQMPIAQATVGLNGDVSCASEIVYLQGAQLYAGAEMYASDCGAVCSVPDSPHFDPIPKESRQSVSVSFVDEIRVSSVSVGHAIVHAHAFATGDVLAEPISILDSSEHLLEHILPPHAKTEIVFVKDGVYFNNGCAYLTVSGENHLLGDHLLDVDQCPTTEDNVGSACISDIADFNVDADLAVKYAKFSAAIDMSESLSDSRISRMHTLPQTGEFMRLTTNGASMTSDSYKTYDHPLLYVNAFTESIRDVRQRGSSSFDTSQVIHFFMSDVNSDDSRYRMNHSPPT